jgi:hypothetical protein
MHVLRRLQFHRGTLVALGLATLAAVRGRRDRVNKLVGRCERPDAALKENRSLVNVVFTPNARTKLAKADQITVQTIFDTAPPPQIALLQAGLVVTVTRVGRSSRRKARTASGTSSSSSAGRRSHGLDDC